MGYYNKSLDDINFKIYHTCEQLKPYIHSYWIVKKQNFEKTHTNKILSDGSMGLVINLSSPYTIKLNNKSVLCSKRYNLDGPTKYPSYINFENDLYLIGIRFNPAGAYIFFDEDISSFLNKNIKFENSDTWPLDDLYDGLKKNDKITDKITLLDKFFVHKLNTSKRKHTAWIFKIISQITEKKGDISISSICKQFQISSRQLERVFKKEIGLSPKIFIRIIRLRNVKDTISSLELDNLTQTAYDFGFFDQAHFTKEFKFFMGETPKNYFNHKLSLAKLHNYKKHS